MTEDVNGRKPLVVYDAALGRKREATQEDIDILEAKALVLGFAVDRPRPPWNPEYGPQD